MWQTFITNISETLTWSALQCTGQIPEGRICTTMHTYKNKLFVFGGYNGRTRLSDLHILDLGKRYPSFNGQKMQ